MRSNSQALTNVALIRDYRPRDVRVLDEDVSRRGPDEEAVRREEPAEGEPSAIRLIERWQAPVVSEEEIEAWAVRYRLCPKSGMSFIEYLIVRGVGHLG